MKSALSILVVTVVLLLTTAGQATATPTTPTAPAITAAAPEAAHTFSNAATQRIYTVFKSGGAAAATGYCVVITPTPWKPFCAAAIVILYELTSGPPGENDCYQLYARFGVPPVGGRVINC